MWQSFNTIAIAASVVSAVPSPTSAQQKLIEPVDFRPFADGSNWIVRQPMVYTIGISKVSITVPQGFVTDFASIPPALQSIIQKNGPYLLPAVVHDYLYWNQSCTRDQADQIFLIAMTEHKVSSFHLNAIYQAVRAAGSFAWDSNARDKAAGLPRILPAAHQIISANMLWPLLQSQLGMQKVTDGPNEPVSPDVCARGRMSVQEALKKP